MDKTTLVTVAIAIGSAAMNMGNPEQGLRQGIRETSMESAVMVELEVESYEQQNTTAAARYTQGNCVLSEAALSTAGLRVQGFRAGVCVVDRFGGTAIIRADGLLDAHASTNQIDIVNQFLKDRGLL